jgi:hypothetical protein
MVTGISLDSGGRVGMVAVYSAASCMHQFDGSSARRIRLTGVPEDKLGNVLDHVTRFFSDWPDPFRREHKPVLFW